MELNKCLKERRSIRKFLDKELKWENLVKILDAGKYAPSSGNIQNWIFIVIKNKEQKRKLADACRQDFVSDANCLIVVCSREDRIAKLYGKRGEKYSMQNCAAAVQNMLLEAYSLGVGSCWVGAFDDDKVSRIVDLEKDITPQAIVILGYSKEEKREAKRNNLENLVFFEKYGNKKREI